MVLMIQQQQLHCWADLGSLQCSQCHRIHLSLCWATRLARFSACNDVKVVYVAGGLHMMPGTP